MKNKSTMWILAALLFGIISGLVCHWLLAADARESLVAVLDTVTHMFLNLIKMIIAPLIFATLSPASQERPNPPVWGSSSAAR